MLQDILAQVERALLPASLLVGIETSDDAAVYRINDTQAIVATTDFFMPIVDDPYDFGAHRRDQRDLRRLRDGRHAAVRARARRHADRRDSAVAMIRDILDGGESVCARAGIPIAGGHTIDSVEPIYGLVAIGLVHPAQREAQRRRARPATGSCSASRSAWASTARRSRRTSCRADDYRTMIASTTQLNTPGIALAQLPCVHAHDRRHGLRPARAPARDLPRLARGRARRLRARSAASRTCSQLARDGFVTGASGRNWAGYGEDVDLAPATRRRRARAADRSADVGRPARRVRRRRTSATCSTIFRREGFERAAEIGEIVAGDAAHPRCLKARKSAAAPTRSRASLVGPAPRRASSIASRGSQRKARALRGARVDRVYSRGKALLIEFDNGLTHYSHNQLYGEWEVRERAGRHRRPRARCAS